MTPVRLEPGVPRSRVKHSTIEPLRSQLCLYKYCITFTSVGYSFEMLKQNKPFGVHEQFMTDEVKVKYVSIILISCQLTKPLRIPQRYVKLLVAHTNYKRLHYL